MKGLDELLRQAEVRLNVGREDKIIRELMLAVSHLRLDRARHETLLKYMATRANWIVEDEDATPRLRRPGGGRQEGIFMYSHDIVPWALLAEFAPKGQEPT